jgi:gamma-glutamyl-gamma-aminobutyrate hydrolase PuuD
MQPKIGISMQKSGSHDTPHTVGHAYVKALLAHGGLPLGIPHSVPANAKSYVAGVDAVLFPGGGDVSPLIFFF